MRVDDTHGLEWSDRDRAECADARHDAGCRPVQLHSEWWRRTVLVQSHRDLTRSMERGAPSGAPLSYKQQLFSDHYGAWNATLLLIASNVFLASSCVAFTCPYHTEPLTFDWLAA
jgi:hypothetical protein